MRVSTQGFLSMDRDPPQQLEGHVDEGQSSTLWGDHNYERLLLVPDHPRGGHRKTSTTNMELDRVCEVPMQQRLPFLPCWKYETSDVTQSIGFYMVMAWFISHRLFIFRFPEPYTPSRRCISDRPSFCLLWGSHLRRPFLVSPSRRSLPNNYRAIRLTHIMLPLLNAVPTVSSRGIAEVRFLPHPSPPEREGYNADT